MLVNSKGIEEINKFLTTHHKLGYLGFDADMLNAWAADAEYNMSEGNGPSIEIKSFDSLTGATCNYTISRAGVDR